MLGYQRETLAIAVLSLLLNAVVTIALLPQFGIMAAAIGTAASQAARAALLRYAALHRADLETFVGRAWTRRAVKALQSAQT